MGTLSASSRPVVRMNQHICRSGPSGCSCERGGAPRHLALTRRGVVGVKVGSVEHLVQPGLGVFSQGGHGYRVFHPGADGHAYTIFEAADEVWEECARHAHRQDCREIRYGPAQHLQHLTTLRALVRAQGDTLAVEELALDLLRAVMSAGREEVRTDTACSRRIVRTAQEALIGRLSENIALADLAAVAGCSAFHLARVFKDSTGLTLRRYRLRQRICAALQRMAAGDDNLTGIAVDVGFSHQSHMTESFRRDLGLTPERARRSLRATELGDAANLALARSTRIT